MGTRQVDWEARLNEAVRDADRREWGPHQCGLFVIQAYAAVTGRIGAEDYVKAYLRGHEAVHELLRSTDRTPETAITRLTGIAPVDGVRAQHGDIVLFERQRFIIGVCLGDRTAVATEYGLAYLRTAAAKKAWKI